MTTCPGSPALSVAGVPERARTAATRSPAALCVAGREPSRPLAHATTAAGQVLVLVPADGEVAGVLGAAPDRDVSALLMVSDRAPVPLRDPVRATLWLSGWLTPVAAADRRAAAVAFAEVRPEEALLDVGTSALLLRLDLAEVVLREGTACAEVSPADFAAARPDPVAPIEEGMLQHLDRDHPDVLAVLRSRVPTAPGETVRPLGIDRFGYRLRVERPGGHRDVRVPFARPLTCPGQLRAATSQLLCALRAGLTRRD
ncbi:DUF2470 domain-containing protein [Geodermatophilus aquaeductus]|uniref:DUF2470 domain-containing protein n=1 Tax=Geodermatophilus aquaeductus TaxID=1564161 RepID=UPI00115C1E5C|nr:DUF2470 domain-containing protein [Geodermatophilus aquaeductus]